MPVTIDPRRHDAVLFDLGTATLDPGLLDRLRDGRVEQVTEAARPGRCVLVTATTAGVEAARAAGFGLVIGLGALPGADATVADLREIEVRIGDLRMSELPDAMSVLDTPVGRPAVFFDFDGTLSEIVNDPGAAVLVDGAADALRQLAARCPVAVLSGRDLGDVRDRVGVPGLWYAGSHGFELTGPDGAHQQNSAAAAAVPVLAQAAAQLRDLLGSITGVVVEHKHFAVAVHYRNAAREHVGDVTAAVRAVGRHCALRVTTGREVIELRPDIDWDKGTTLRWILDQMGAAFSPIYLGDDITDEDAFDAVRQDGIAILVRHNDDGDRATGAQFALGGPTQVCEFTRRLAAACGQ